MQDVEVTVLDSGLWICHSKSCRFRYECANHTTAGDFRTECGFTPELQMHAAGVWSCKTIDAEAEYNEPAWLRNDAPKGDFRTGALLADGSTCNPHVEAPKTFCELLEEANALLNQAWDCVPLGNYQPWQVQEKLTTCRDAFTTLLNLVRKDR